VPGSVGLLVGFAAWFIAGVAAWIVFLLLGLRFVVADGSEERVPAAPDAPTATS